MGVISVSGPQFGQRYSINIAGETPTPQEQARINNFITQKETELARKIEGRFAPSPQSEIQEQVVEQEPEGGFGTAVGMGIDQLQKAYGSSLEGIGGLTGLTGLETYGQSVIEANEKQIAEKAQGLTRREDIDTVGEAASFFVETLGQQVPQLGTTLTGAAAGALVGGPIGAIVGGALANIPYFYGDNREAQKEAIDRGLRTEMSEGTAFLAALPQAALDSIADRLLIGKVLNPSVIRSGGIFTRAVKGVGVGTVAEVPTEIGQEIINRYQAGLPIDDEEAFKVYEDVAIAAGITGGTVRGATNVIGGDARKQQKAKEEEEAFRELQEDAQEDAARTQENINRINESEQREDEDLVVDPVEEQEKLRARQDEIERISGLKYTQALPAPKPQETDRLTPQEEMIALGQAARESTLPFNPVEMSQLPVNERILIQNARRVQGIDQTQPASLDEIRRVLGEEVASREAIKQKPLSGGTSRFQPIENKSFTQEQFDRAVEEIKGQKKYTFPAIQKAIRSTGVSKVPRSMALDIRDEMVNRGILRRSNKSRNGYEVEPDIEAVSDEIASYRKTISDINKSIQAAKKERVGVLEAARRAQQLERNPRKARELNLRADQIEGEIAKAEQNKAEVEQRIKRGPLSRTMPTTENPKTILPADLVIEETINRTGIERYLDMPQSEWITYSPFFSDKQSLKRFTGVDSDLKDYRDIGIPNEDAYIYIDNLRNQQRGVKSEGQRAALAQSVLNYDRDIKLQKQNLAKLKRQSKKVSLPQVERELISEIEADIEKKTYLRDAAQSRLEAPSSPVQVAPEKAEASAARSLSSRAANTTRKSSFDARRQQVFNALRQRLTRLGLPDVKLTAEKIVAPELLQGDSPALVEGVFSSSDSNKIIALSMEIVDPTKSPQEQFDVLKSVMNHEVIHALKNLGLFSDAEWNSLRRSVAERKYVHIKDGKPVERKYTYLDRAKSMYTGMGLNDASIEEEAIAEMFRDYADGKIKIGGRPRTLFERIKDFFGAIFGANQDSGFNSVEDIFDNIRSGKVGGRERIAPDPEAEVEAESRAFSLKRFTPELPMAPPEARAHKLPYELLIKGNGQDPIVPITQKFTPANAARNNSAIELILENNPDAMMSVENWAKAMQEALGGDFIPAPPLVGIEYSQNPRVMADKLKQLTPELKKGVDEGFAFVDQIRDIYESGNATPRMTMDLFVWGILSRGAGPVQQEGAFIDVIDSAYPLLEKATREPLTDDDVDRWMNTVSSVIPEGSPGKQVTMNVNAAAKLVKAMSEFVGDSNRTVIDLIHEGMSDPNTSAASIRDLFLSTTEGAGIDNKVLSFILLVGGKDDVLVMDRIQGRHLWDDGRYGGANIYDGIGPNKEGLNGIFRGPRGILTTRILEDGMRKNVQKAYELAGRPEDASLGRWHWETWVIEGEQVVNHGTLQAIINGSPIGTSVTEGKTDTFSSGMTYIRGQNAPVVEYPLSDGDVVYMSPTRMKEFEAFIKNPKNGVIPKGFKVTGRADIPWYERKEVDREKLDNAAREFENAKSNGAILRSDERTGEGQDASRRGNSPIDRRYTTEPEGITDYIVTEDETKTADVDLESSTELFDELLSNEETTNETKFSIAPTNPNKLVNRIVDGKPTPVFGSIFEKGKLRPVVLPAGNHLRTERRDGTVLERGSGLYHIEQRRHDKELERFSYTSDVRRVIGDIMDIWRRQRYQDGRKVISTPTRDGYNLEWINEITDGKPSITLVLKERKLGSEYVFDVQTLFMPTLPKKDRAVVDGRTKYSIAAATDSAQFFNDAALRQAANQNDKSREILSTMPIQNFLSAALSGRSIEKEMTTERLLRSGEKFESVPVLYVRNNGDGTGTVTGHEGRHRARAIAKLGYKEMPVKIISQGGDGRAIRWGQQDDVNNFDYVPPNERPSILIGEDGNTVPMPNVEYDFNTEAYSIAPTKFSLNTTAGQIFQKEVDLNYARASNFLSKGLGIVVGKDKAQDAADKILTNFQDRMLPVGRMIQDLKAKGLTIVDAMDTYLKEELFHGIVGNEITKRENTIYKAAVDAVKLLNISKNQINDLKSVSDRAANGRGFVSQAIETSGSDRLTLVDTYLYAKHAKERNAYVRSINPNNDSGSGMTDAEANAILTWFSNLDNNNSVALGSLDRAVREIVKNTNETRVNAGLIPADFDEVQLEDGSVVRRSNYDFYVPLRGKIDPDNDSPDPSRPRRAAPYGAKGREDPRVTGRYDYATNILATTINQNQNAVSRGERNIVGQSFLKLLRADPEKTREFGTILETLPKTEQLRSGKVVRATDPMAFLDPFIYTVKENGQDVYVRLEDERIAKALKGETGYGSGPLDYVLRGMGKINRYLSNINTSYNPEFFITNLLRDLQTAGVNVAQFNEKGLTTQVVKDLKSALLGIKRSIRNNDDSSEWSKIYKDFVAAGGQNATNQMNTIADQMEDIQGILGDISDQGLRGKWNSVKNSFIGKKTGSLLNMVENYNTIVENGVRVSTYKSLLDRGFSRERAAQAARNVTVNFAKGGEYKQFMNAFYLFYNASLQGSFALLNAALRSKKVQKLWGGVIAAGFLQDQLNSVLSEEDDDGKRIYDKIPDYILEHNLILPDPFGFTERSYIAIPMPYGLNMAHNIGRATSQVARGGTTVGKGTSSIVGTIVDTINPIGGTESFPNLVAPTVADPFIDVLENEDFAKKPIYKEGFPGDRGPDSQRYWSTTNPSAIWVSNALNDISGGTSEIKGFIDVSPDVLNFWLEYATGGVGRFVQRTAELPVRVATEGFDEEIYREVPFIRKVIGSVSDREDYGSFIEKRDRILSIGDELRAAAKSGDRERLLRTRQEYPEEVKFLPRIKAIDSALTKISRQMNAIKDNKRIPDSQKELLLEKLDEKKQSLIARANKILADF